MSLNQLTNDYICTDEHWSNILKSITHEVTEQIDISSLFLRELREEYESELRTKLDAQKTRMNSF